MASKKTRKVTSTKTNHKGGAAPVDDYDDAAGDTSLQKQLQQMKTKYKTLERENQTLEKENQTLQKENQTLQKENETLRIENKTLMKNDGRTLKVSMGLNSKKERSSSASHQSGKAVSKGCNCKGNCASRVCGCVKRDVQCAEFCKCDDATCQNQEPDKENIGNANGQDTMKEMRQNLSKMNITNNNPDILKNVSNSTPKNKLLDRTKKSKGLFSPSSPDSVFEEQEMDNMTVEFTMPRRTLTFDSNETDPNIDVQGKEPEKEIRQIRKRRAQVPKEKGPRVPIRSVSNEETMSNEQLPMGRTRKRSFSSGAEGRREESKSPVAKTIRSGRNVATTKLKQTKVKDDIREFKPLRSRVKKYLETQEDRNEDVKSVEQDISELPTKESLNVDTDQSNQSAQKGDTLQQINEVQGNHISSINEFDPELTADFNPMRPRHQLIRSPLDKSKDTLPSRLTEVFLRPPESDKEEEILSPPAGIEQPQVDWEEHQKQLVPCKRCKRKFFPHRLKKHEANCKRI